MPSAGIYHYLIASFFVSIVAGCWNSVPQVDHLHEANTLLDKGNLALDNNHFNEAIAFYENALIHSRFLGEDQNLTSTISGKIKQTKARSLIHHFKVSSTRSDNSQNDLLPSTLETKDFKIIQSFGDISLTRTWSNKKISTLDTTVGIGRKITSHSNAGIEICSNHQNYIIRTVGPSGFILDDKKSIFINSGAYFISGEKNLSEPLSIEFPLGKVTFWHNKNYAFFLEVTTNGGCKLICLVGQPKFQLSNQELIELQPGELIFVTADEFSRKMNIELSTFIASSNLISDFEEPPDFAKKMKQNALIQAIRTKKHFRVLVGDAKNEQDFEVKILDDESEKK